MVERESFRVKREVKTEEVRRIKKIENRTKYSDESEDSNEYIADYISQGSIRVEDKDACCQKSEVEHDNVEGNFTEKLNFRKS